MSRSPYIDFKIIDKKFKSKANLSLDTYDDVTAGESAILIQSTKNNKNRHIAKGYDIHDTTLSFVELGTDIRKFVKATDFEIIKGSVRYHTQYKDDASIPGTGWRPPEYQLNVIRDLLFIPNHVELVIDYKPHMMSGYGLTDANSHIYKENVDVIHRVITMLDTELEVGANRKDALMKKFKDAMSEEIKKDKLDKFVTEG